MFGKSKKNKNNLPNGPKPLQLAIVGDLHPEARIINHECCQDMIRELGEKLKYKFYDAGYRVFVTNGTKGVAQIAFWAVVYMRQHLHAREAMNVVMLPYQNMDADWDSEEPQGKNDFKRMMKYADEVHVMYKIKDESQEDDAIRLTCKKMVDESMGVLAITEDNYWHDKDHNSVVAKTMQYAMKTGTKDLYRGSTYVDVQGNLHIESVGFIKRDYIDSF